MTTRCNECTTLETAYITELINAVGVVTAETRKAWNALNIHRTSHSTYAIITSSLGDTIASTPQAEVEG